MGFSIKDNADARLKATKLGLSLQVTHKLWIDYEVTFALAARSNTTLVLISCAVNLGWKLEQLDVTNTFLNTRRKNVCGSSSKLLFRPTEGRASEQKKPLYGLTQSPFHRFHRA